jgi:tellurite resistance protein
MDLQTGLLSVIGFLSTGLSAAVKILWDRWALSEKELKEIREKYQQLQLDYGKAFGRLEAMNEFEKQKTNHINLP